MQKQSLLDKARKGRVIALNSISGQTGDRARRRKSVYFQSVRVLSPKANTDRLFDQYATLRAAA